MTRWIADLHRMRSLEAGWNGYRADPPSPAAIDVMTAVLSEVEAGFAPPDRVAPSANGGVGATFRRQGRKVYVEAYNDGRCCVLYSDGHTEPSSHPVRAALGPARELAREIAGYLAGGEPAAHEERITCE